MPIQSTVIVESPSLENLFRGKDDGLPLANGIVTWYADDNRTQSGLKDIYQQVRQPDGTYQYTTLPNPLTLSSIGTYVDNSGNDINVYLYPYEGSPNDVVQGPAQKYYVTVYAAAPPIGDSSLQFTRENWPPDNGGGNNPTDLFEGTENQLANPQFVEVLFQPDSGAATYTFSVSGPSSVLIAPDWYIDTTGSGTVVVQQIPDVSLSATSNPSYALAISSSGVDSIHLKQRLVHSPKLFKLNYVCGSVDATSTTSSQVLLAMYFAPSSGTAIRLFSGLTGVAGSFATITDTGQKITTENPDSATDGYVDVYVDIPPNKSIQITSLQIVSVQNSTSSTQFLQESEARQIDHLFHYYKPELDYKPIQSYLIGWDFPFNPTQPLGPTVAVQNTGANKSTYVWDQTIFFQTVNQSIDFLRSLTTNGLTAHATLASSFALVQYLPAATAREILSQGLSVQIKGAVSAGTLKGTVSMYWTTDASLPDIKTPTFNSIVSSITGGVPATANGAWTIVPRDTLGNVPYFTLTTTNQSFDFSGFDASATAGKTTATFFAIVVAFDTVTIGSSVTIDYISLVPGQIPTRSGPQSSDQVLKQCQYYFQSSFLPGVAPAGNAGASSGQSYGIQVPGSGVAAVGPIIRFPVQMITTPVITRYSPVNSGTQIYDATFVNNWTSTNTALITANGFVTQGVTPVGSTAGDISSIHWTADARLGTY